jgi:site-specific DNA-methyltransferase (adenine-specific)
MTLWHGDLFDVLPTLADASIDACVTDPPYGIGFMGEEWDTFTPGTVKEFRGGKTADHTAHQNPNLKNRKSWSAGAAVQYDYSPQSMRQFQAWCRAWGAEVWRVLKPGAHVLVCGAPRSYHRLACGLEEAGFEVRDSLCWLFGQGFPKSLNLDGGLGTALKPAFEPIVLARKPVQGSITANVEAYGTGALNIDACRVEGFKPEMVGVQKSTIPAIFKTSSARRTGEMSSVGRWPANVALDDVAAAMLDEQSGELTSGANPTRRQSDKFRDVFGEFKGQEACAPARGLDVGGASRFFYVAKPGRAERDRGCSDEPQDYETSGPRGHAANGDGSPRPRPRPRPRRNSHPTVKPVELMRWLVRLVTPPRGIVLDPFCGSGTTGMACRFEDREFVGVEREAKYVAIAQQRIADCLPLMSEPVEVIHVEPPTLDLLHADETA